MNQVLQAVHKINLKNEHTELIDLQNQTNRDFDDEMTNYDSLSSRDAIGKGDGENKVGIREKYGKFETNKREAIKNIKSDNVRANFSRWFDNKASTTGNSVTRKQHARSQAHSLDVYNSSKSIQLEQAKSNPDGIMSIKNSFIESATLAGPKGSGVLSEERYQAELLAHGNSLSRTAATAKYNEDPDQMLATIKDFNLNKGDEQLFRDKFAYYQAERNLKGKSLGEQVKLSQEMTISKKQMLDAQLRPRLQNKVNGLVRKFQANPALHVVDKVEDDFANFVGPVLPEEKIDSSLAYQALEGVPVEAKVLDTTVAKSYKKNFEHGTAQDKLAIVGEIDTLGKHKYRAMRESGVSSAAGLALHMGDFDRETYIEGAFSKREKIGIDQDKAAFSMVGGKMTDMYRAAAAKYPGNAYNNAANDMAQAVYNAGIQMNDQAKAEKFVDSHFHVIKESDKFIYVPKNLNVDPDSVEDVLDDEKKKLAMKYWKSGNIAARDAVYASSWLVGDGGYQLVGGRSGEALPTNNSVHFEELQNKIKKFKKKNPVRNRHGL